MAIFFGEESHTAEGVPNKYGRAFDLANVATRNHGILSTAPRFQRSGGCWKGCGEEREEGVVFFFGKVSSPICLGWV